MLTAAALGRNVLKTNECYLFFQLRFFSLGQLTCLRPTSSRTSECSVQGYSHLLQLCLKLRNIRLEHVQRLPKQRTKHREHLLHYLTQLQVRCSPQWSWTHLKCGESWTHSSKSSSSSGGDSMMFTPVGGPLCLGVGFEKSCCRWLVKTSPCYRSPRFASVK